jgi:hypothetical protein
MKRIGLALALCAAFLSTEALAWGDQGHVVVGSIASRLIAGSNAEKQMKALLLPGETMEQAVVFADCTKGTFCTLPHTTEMDAYAAANPQQSSYHFADLPPAAKAYQVGLPGTNDHDVVQITRQAIAVLQGHDDAGSNPHKFTRRQALLLVLHMVADLSQPQHVGSPYMDKDNHFVTPATPAEVDDVNVFDLRGGSSLFFADSSYDRVLYPNQPNQPIRPQNMHYFFDISNIENLDKMLGVSTAEGLADKLMQDKKAFAAVPPNTGDAADWSARWATEVLPDARALYAGAKVVDRKTNTTRAGKNYFTWTVSVPDNYREESARAAGNLLVRGGVNLAALLQKIWP